MDRFKGYKLVFYYLGTFLMMIGGIILIPLIMLIFYPQDLDYAYCFLIPGIVTIFFGYLIRYLLKDVKKDNLLKNQDSILVVLVWICSILISAIPFILTGNYTFHQAVFETTSGYSTTGLSIVDVNTCPHIFLFFRSIMLFVGGVGLVLILTCAISDRYGLRLYNAEGHTDKLIPNLAKSARLIFSIYTGYITLGTIAYCLCGMELFDALNHAIAALSTGGFSTKSTSIMYYNSIGIDIVTMVLMILGGTNFVIHLFLFRRQFKAILKHCEIRFMLCIVTIFTLIMSLILIFNNYDNVPLSIEKSLFQLISCITTTGFQNIPSMSELPHGFIFIMILLMLIGGGLGSTAGGIKQYRIIVTFKALYYNYRDKLLPNKTITSHYILKNGKIEELSEDEIHSNLTYVLLYLLIFLIGSFLISLFGYNIEEAMFEFVSSLSTVGLSIGITSPSAHPLILWIMILGMFLGRLEILVVFNALSRIKKDVLKIKRI